MGAKALCRGRSHIIVAVDDELQRLAKGERVIGLPAREAFPGFANVHAVMDWVYANGVELRIPDVVNTLGEVGVNVIQPVFRDGQVWGVVSDWIPLPSAPRPTSDEALPPGLVPARLA